MRSSVLMFFTAACSANVATALPSSPCHEEAFEGSAFVICEPEGGAISVRSGHRRFAELRLDPATVGFAMNAGMFDDAGRPIGLMIEDGQQVHALNTRDGAGNFHLKPNGVFLVRKDGHAEVVTSERYKFAPDIAFATQSGPMLLIDGESNAKFDADGVSRYVRNGVGIDAAGKPHFVISLDVVSFGKLARFFRQRTHAVNALYFDGSVSSLWDPANARQDNFTELGPMVVVSRAGSKPDRGGRATP